MFKVGDKVDVYSVGRSSKVPGEVVVILSPGGSDDRSPVIVKHKPFGGGSEDIYQSFTHRGNKASDREEIRLEHAKEYRYMNIWSRGTMNTSSWIPHGEELYRGPYYIGTLRCVWKDKDGATEVEFSKDGKFD